MSEDADGEETDDSDGFLHACVDVVMEGGAAVVKAVLDAY